MICILWMQQFLEHHTYVTPAEARNQARQQNITIGPTVKVTHRPQQQQGGVAAGRSTVYHVVDNGRNFSKDDWNRVVAVFAQGQEWQFKGWPWPHPAHLFSKVRGFHLKVEDARPMHENIKKWNVELLTLSPQMRHKDAPAALSFWNALLKKSTA